MSSFDAGGGSASVKPPNLSSAEGNVISRHSSPTCQSGRRGAGCAQPDASRVAEASPGVQLQQTTVDDGDGADVLLHLVFRDVGVARGRHRGPRLVRWSSGACHCRHQAPACPDAFQLDAFQPEAEALLLEQLLAHLSEIEGDSEHGGSRWTSGWLRGQHSSVKIR